MLTGKGDLFRVWPTMPKNSVQEAALLDSMIKKLTPTKRKIAVHHIQDLN